MNEFKRFADLKKPSPPRDDDPVRWHQAALYLPPRGLVTALELAWNVQQPLLLTGEPGSGKTTAAYWAAWRMGLEPAQLVHAQIRSDSTAGAFKYQFNVIRYFRESHLAAQLKQPFDDNNREPYIERGPLWQAFDAAQRGHVVLLLDEIDKAPRDFPNDLLREFEERSFEVPDWPLPGGDFFRKSAPPLDDTRGIVLVVLSSNGERKLPGAFLRRCLHYHLKLERAWIQRVVALYQERGTLRISPELAELALERYLGLHATASLSHRPGLGEYLVWLRILSMDTGMSVARLKTMPLKEWPYLHALLKDPDDHNLL